MKQPPKHLTRASKALWRQIVGEYGLDDEAHALEVLRLALEALDRCKEARLAVAEDGAYVTDRFGQVKAHPAIAVERDSRIAAMRAFRELSLDADAPVDPRLPRVGGGRS